MRFGPPVHFTHDPNGSRLAYQVLGTGEQDLVFLLGWPSHLGLMWENPAFADFLHGLASFSRLILLDHLGRGLSDRGPNGRPFEDRMDDVRAVLRAVGSEATAFFGCHLGGRLALLFAATHPQHTTAVVTFAAHPATLRDADFPWGSTPEQREELLSLARAGMFDVDEILAEIAPSDVGDASMRRWWGAFLNSAVTPPEAVDEITSHGPVDIRGLLGSVHAPTLVLHRTHDRFAAVEAGRYLAAHLPRARLVELPGEDNLPFAGDQESVLTATEEFLTGTARVGEPDRAVLTVMFTDIVGSTELASRLGDRRWRRLLEEHNEVVRSTLPRFGGREIDTAGDGFLITFDGPARAIRAAAAVRAGLADDDIRIRVGLHTGECELVDGKVRGIAVHVAARVMAHAEGGQILCSRTVKDLVAGSGFVFTDRGTHRLKGVPDDWQLYAVELT
jgi:class 3 adenylate cyclase